MIFNDKIVGKKVILRALELSDCNEIYLNWLKDKEVNQYLETRWQEQSIDTIKDFVLSIRESIDSYFFAIIYEDKQVGNIKLGPIHPIYKFADIGYLIGDRSVWGKGIATEAIGLIIKFAFETLNLNRIEAGVYSQNTASQKALLKNGFIRDAIYKKRCFVHKDEAYCDTYNYAILKEDWEKSQKQGN